MPPRHSALLNALRARIAAIEGGGSAPEAAAVLPFGIPEIDAALPGGGLVRGALHEVVGPGGAGGDGAAVGFCAMLLGRLTAGGGTALWCSNDAARACRGDSPGILYGPGLLAFGLDPARLILARARCDTEALWAMEEGLRAPVLAAVVGEVEKIDLAAARRLQLAAAASGTPALLLRPHADAAGPTAARTRWRLSPLPGPAEGAVSDRSHWQAELLRCRGGRPGMWRLAWLGSGTGPGLVLAQEAAPPRPRGVTSPPSGAAARTAAAR